MMSVLLELLCYVPGCVFFPGSFVCLRSYFRNRLQSRQKKLENEEDIEGIATAVAMRYVMHNNKMSCASHVNALDESSSCFAELAKIKGHHFFLLVMHKIDHK